MFSQSATTLVVTKTQWCCRLPFQHHLEAITQTAYWILQRDNMIVSVCGDCSIYTQEKRVFNLTTKKDCTACDGCQTKSHNKPVYTGASD